MTRWIRWNPTSKIFEHSTDSGTSWNPLPLNASILTEGELHVNRLPSGLVRGDAQNSFTHARPIDINSAQPILDLRESDQAADQRRARLTLTGGALKYQAVNDAYDVFNDRLALTRGGVLSLTPAAGSNLSHEVIGSVTGAHRLRIRNTADDVGNLSQLALGNDAEADLVALSALASNFASSGWSQAAGGLLRVQGAGGLSLAADHASGALRLYTGGITTPRLSISAGGVVSLSGDLTVGGAFSALNQVRCYAYHNTSQSINDTTWTALQFNSEEYDVGNIHDVASNNSRFNIPANGVYLLTGQAWANNGGNVGLRMIKFVANSNTELGGVQAQQTNNNAGLTTAIVTYLSSGSYVELHAYQGSGAALQFGTGTFYSHNRMTVTRIL